MDWKADSKTRGYVFSYDGQSRLTQASYSENGTGNGHYNTEYTYDKMGNVQTLTRYGLRDNNQYGLIDNLTFTYNGNQVTRVEDAVSGPFYSGAFHFVNGSNATTEYTYDQNGNTTKDLNKGISSIQYNLLNLPSRITYSDGRMADYVYSATGTKLSVTYTNGGSIKNNQYCGNMLYENGTLKQILIDGGYITFNGSTPQYHFYLKDHLGNNRVVLNAGGIVEQVNHYYPYGGLMGESTNGDIQRYKYNGKELDRMNGLDWYDYGARHMGGIRFTTMDPMAEKYYDVSPYVYCVDSPMRYVDLYGEKPTYAESLAMAQHVYGDVNDDVLIGGWRPSTFNIGLQLSNPENGLNSMIYERIIDGEVTEYAYVLAGTVEAEDLIQDGKQILGLSEQYMQSMENAELLSVQLSDRELTYIGHSLGAGEAAVNLLATAHHNPNKRQAIGFNSAGVSNATLKNLGLNRKYEYKITSYEMGADIISWGERSISFLPAPLGKRVLIPEPEKFPNWKSHRIGSFPKK